MTEYIKSPDAGENEARFLVDSETGEMFQVVEINHKGQAAETLTVASLALIETSMALTPASTHRRATRLSCCRIRA